MNKTKITVALDQRTKKQKKIIELIGAGINVADHQDPLMLTAGQAMTIDGTGGQIRRSSV